MSDEVQNNDKILVNPIRNISPTPSCQSSWYGTVCRGHFARNYLTRMKLCTTKVTNVVTRDNRTGIIYSLLASIVTFDSL